VGVLFIGLFSDWFFQVKIPNFSVYNFVVYAGIFVENMSITHFKKKHHSISFFCRILIRTLCINLLDYLYAFVVESK
jgi:antibiotic biosynthesis monooxygenase (ABM) superfamily enzyme